MKKQEIKDFFDRLAPYWDDSEVRDEAVTELILDNAGIVENVRLLDVACGTGVLFPYYISRGALPRWDTLDRSRHEPRGAS